jgi:hypothetical protein
MVCGRVAGTSHAETGDPCQDAGLIKNGNISETPVLTACVSDGAGSARHSEAGAHLACEVFDSIVQREASAGHLFDNWSQDAAVQWCREIRESIEERASELGVVSRQLACTLLGAVVAQEEALFLQIGDGAIVRFQEGEYRTVFWPQSGEFANTTHFLTDDLFHESLESWHCKERVDEFAMFTDGMERLVLRFADRTVHEPFLTPLFAVLRAADQPGLLVEPLHQFLDSENVNQRTDDDKTLILATRISQCDEYDETC